MTLASSGPDLDIPEPLFLEHFYVGLNPKTKEFLDGASRGSFLHLIPNEGRAILERILENTPFKPPDEPSLPVEEDTHNSTTNLTSDPSYPPKVEKVPKPPHPFDLGLKPSPSLYDLHGKFDLSRGTRWRHEVPEPGTPNLKKAGAIHSVGDPIDKKGVCKHSEYIPQPELVMDDPPYLDPKSGISSNLASDECKIPELYPNWARKILELGLDFGGAYEELSHLNPKPHEHSYVERDDTNSLDDRDTPHKHHRLSLTLNMFGLWAHVKIQAFSQVRRILRSRRIHS